MIDRAALDEYIKKNCAEKKSGSSQLRGLASRISVGKNSPFISGIDPRLHPGFAKIKIKLDAENEDFVDRLFHYINLKGKTHPEIYTEAGMTPDCFSKIISRKTKKPTKENVIALGIALKLNLEEMEDLLSSAGYAFTNSRSDIICRFCFEINSCTLDELNQVLVDYSCQPVGGRK